MSTDDLIEQMARELTPVASLPAPGKRTLAWTLGAAVCLGLLVAGVAAVGGVGWSSVGASFWLSQAAAIATGVLASVAAFASVVPGAAGGVRWWAAAAAVVWLVTLAGVPVGNVEWSSVAAADELPCVGFIVLGGVPLAVLLVRMLRRGAPLTPAATAAFAALAVGSLASVGACLSLPHANGVITLVWHGGVVLALVALAGWGGRRLFSWRGYERSG